TARARLPLDASDEPPQHAEYHGGDVIAGHIRRDRQHCFAQHRSPAAAAKRSVQRMIVHVVDGTYELFRHFYGLRRFNKGKDKPFGAVVGVLQTVLQMIEQGATHVGVATDHIIESFRNRMWPGYKTSEGIEPALFAQVHPLEEAVAAMGVVVWPRMQREAEDALAYAARMASEDERAE